MRNSAGAALRQPNLYLRDQWRTNTVGIGALGVLGLAALALVFFFHGPLFGRTQAGGKPAHEYRLSHDAIALSGTREKLFVLQRWDTGSDQAGGASVNLLVVDTGDASSRWMFPDNGQTILTRDEIRTSDGALAPVSGLVLTVANTDGEKQRESLYYYRVSGGPAVRFLTADAIVAADQAGPDRYLAVYRDGAHTIAAVYSLIDLRVLTEKPAPDVPQ